MRKSCWTVRILLGVLRRMQSMSNVGKALSSLASTAESPKLGDLESIETNGSSVFTSMQ